MKTILNIYLDAFRGLPRDVWLLSAVLFINRSGTMVLTFMTLYVTQELGWSLTVAGQILSIYGVGHLSGALIGGWLCDRVGALRIQFLSLLFSGLGFLIFEHLRSVSSVMIATLLIATAAEAFRPANGAALAAFSPPHLRTRAVALNRMALNLGFSAGPAIGGWLAMKDYGLIFRFDGATCILAAFLLAALFYRHQPVVTRSTMDEESTSPVHPIHDRIFLTFLVLVVLFTLCFFQGWSTYPVFLNEVYGLSESQFGLLMTLNALLILAFEMVLTHRAEAFRPFSVIGAGTFLFGLGMAVLVVGRSWELAIVSVLIWTLGEMLLAPAAGGWVANRAAAKYRGQYMGLYTMAWGVGFIIGPAAGAWIYQVWGATTLWLATGLLGAVVWLGFEVLQKADSKQRQLVPVEHHSDHGEQQEHSVEATPPHAA